MKLKSVKIKAHNDVQRSYYEEQLDKKIRLIPTESTYIKRHIERLLNFGNLSTSERILEVGCGMGKYTLPLAKNHLRIEGMDLSPVLLKYFEKFKEENQKIPLHCFDILDCPPAFAGQFDVVLGFFALHHLVDLKAAFHAFMHYIRPGGRIIFFEPNGVNPLYYFQIMITPGMSWAGDKGLLKMTKRKLTTAISDAGFDNLKFECFGMLPPMCMNRSFGPALEDWINSFGLIDRVGAFLMLEATKPDTVIRGNKHNNH